MMAYAYWKQEELKVCVQCTSIICKSAALVSTTLTIPLRTFPYHITLYLWFVQKLETDNEDSFLNAEWADPHGLKRQFTGTGNISWRPK